MEYMIAQKNVMCHSCPASECGVKLQQESSIFSIFLITLFLDSHFRGNDIKRNFFWTAFIEKREPDLRTMTDLLRKLLLLRCY